MIEKTKEHKNYFADNRKDLVTYDNKLTKLGALALCFVIVSSINWFFKNLNSN